MKYRLFFSFDPIADSGRTCCDQLRDYVTEESSAQKEQKLGVDYFAHHCTLSFVKSDLAPAVGSTIGDL
jgi:hypothetical protein